MLQPANTINVVFQDFPTEAQLRDLLPNQAIVYLHEIQGLKYFIKLSNNVLEGESLEYCLTAENYASVSSRSDLSQQDKDIISAAIRLRAGTLLNNKQVQFIMYSDVTREREYKRISTVLQAVDSTVIEKLEKFFLKKQQLEREDFNIIMDEFNRCEGEIASLAAQEKLDLSLFCELEAFRLYCELKSRFVFLQRNPSMVEAFEIQKAPIKPSSKRQNILNTAEYVDKNMLQEVLDKCHDNLFLTEVMADTRVNIERTKLSQVITI